MRAYLSIDLDFWNRRNFPEEYLNHLMATGIPVTVASQHHHLVPHIRQFDFDTLINLDYHSDVADREEGMRGKFSRQVGLQCGTWVNHIPGKDKHYIWSYPFASCFNGAGTCHDFYNPFIDDNSEKICGWTKVSHRLLWYPRYCDVVAAGIAISKGWSDDRLIREFLKWQKQYPQLPRKRAA